MTGDYTVRNTNGHPQEIGVPNVVYNHTANA